jgi:hypothetical protein
MVEPEVNQAYQEQTEHDSDEPVPPPDGPGGQTAGLKGSGGDDLPESGGQTAGLEGSGDDNLPG